MSINKSVMYANFGDLTSRGREIKPPKQEINDRLWDEILLIKL